MSETMIEYVVVLTHKVKIITAATSPQEALEKAKSEVGNTQFTPHQFSIKEQAE